jgi:hypothetical protein
MSSHSAFATGDEDYQLPGVPALPVTARPPRRSTSGTAPSPFAVPAMRPGWAGGKPPPGSLQRDIAAHAAGHAEKISDFSDDEDYLRGRDLQRRHEQEQRERKRQQPPSDDDEDDYDDEDDEGGYVLQRCICDGVFCSGCPLHGVKTSTLERLKSPPPAPVPLQRQVAAITGSSAVVAPEPSSSSSSSSSSNVSTLMESAVREAFRQGIEQGKRMQLPQQCKTCAVRKERNRLAAKESRHKKRREAEIVNTRSLIAAAADVAASRVTPMVAPSPAAAAGAGAGAVAAGADRDDGIPPPF